MRLCVTLLVCCLLFIWGNSLLPGNISGAISDFVNKVLSFFFEQGEKEPENGGFLLRKMAHFTEFGLLGMCLGWLFGMLRKKKTWPIALGVAAACVDETIQRFVPGRVSSLKDVAIDSCGMLTGMLLLYCGHIYCKRRRTKHFSEDM